MTTEIGLWSLIGLLGIAGTAGAQTYRLQRSAPQQQPAAQPRQAASPPYASFHGRSDPRQQLPSPFTLTPFEQAQLDRVLKAWEKHSADVKTFESRFTRWEYDEVFGNKFIDQGQLKYKAPDKGMFQVFGDRRENWICDGKSIFEYDFQKEELIEYKLPLELQGKAIVDGPLPFLFGATAEALKGRYFLRVITPKNAQGQVWLEARPRFRQDAENFKRAELILQAASMQPSAIQIHQPNGKSRTVYRFEDPKVNAQDPLQGLDPLRILTRDPFRPQVPRGWTKRVEEAPATQASRPFSGTQMRPADGRQAAVGAERAVGRRQ